METFTFKVVVPVGIHVRNAMILSQKAAEFKSTIKITLREREADAKKLMDVMLLRVHCNDVLTFAIEGTDEKDAFLQLKEFCEKNF